MNFSIFQLYDLCPLSPFSLFQDLLLQLKNMSPLSEYFIPSGLSQHPPQNKSLKVKGGWVLGTISLYCWNPDWQCGCCNGAPIGGFIGGRFYKMFRLGLSETRVFLHFLALNVRYISVIYK